ncbi:MAG: response regulator [archaeon]
MKRVLLVDDDPHLLELIKTVLKQKGYEVTVARSGQECLDWLERMKPDLILLDVMMPGMDGKEVCRRIRANPETKDLKIAFLTVMQKYDIGIEFMEKLNVLDCLTKSFPQEDLLDKVDQILQK